MASHSACIRSIVAFEELLVIADRWKCLEGWTINDRYNTELVSRNVFLDDDGPRGAQWLKCLNDLLENSKCLLSGVGYHQSFASCETWCFNDQLFVIMWLQNTWLCGSCRRCCSQLSECCCVSWSFWRMLSSLLIELLILRDQSRVCQLRRSVMLLPGKDDDTTFNEEICDPIYQMALLSRNHKIVSVLLDLR